ncbi:MAG: sigma-70 family RNA polymerase sigma factor [Lachnospiraceae bacterium]|nr:sigma-70 family RNA polymerase sigma factor [Lachnospiraceae bacterium]
MEDEKIVGLLWERKEKGLEELKNKYGKQIERLAERILPKEDAKECINDTYLAVWNSIPPQRPKFLFAYIARICRNYSYNKVEWNTATKRKAEIVELSTELEQCIPDLMVSLEQRELGELISNFLRELPDEKKRIFVRRYWYGDSIKELSKSYGYRESKIKSILFRVRNQLKEYLEEEGIFL